VIDALIPSGVCVHCDEANADQNYWVCKGCWVSVRRFEAPGRSAESLALYRYEGVVQTLLARAKHPLEPAIYKTLLDADFDLPENAIYVPVPTPWRRRFMRRGCQTTCIAELLANRFDGSVSHALRRHRHLRRQAKLDGESRRALPANAFVRRYELPSDEIVVLVDDVVTTGTTLARARVALGHQQVRCFAVAQVP